jgi:AcrR family transcriptional regulator
MFLQDGYGDASMDEIAAVAMVPPQTVYANFPDKERLFTELVTSDIGQAEQQTRAFVQGLPANENFRRDLQQFARRLITIVMQPHLVQLRRLLIAEAGRFPELARTWYERGPERAHAGLAERFGELTRQGRLRVNDPELAAQHFTWLVLSVPLNRAMFQPDIPSNIRELEDCADEAVRVFLAAYGAP